MEMRLRTESDVRAFSIVVTIVALVGNLLLQHAMMPPDVLSRVQFGGAVIAVTLAAPISYFVGQRMLDVHRLTVKLERAVTFDRLTGARTRASFYDVALSQPHGSEAAVILADVDFFKTINDRYGHLAGDKALAQFSRTLICNLRETDIVARYGGEEFVVLLPQTSLTRGQNTAHRLCRAIRDTPVVIDGQAVQLTASFGVSIMTFPESVDAVIGRADHALYRAKNDGRDRVCTYDSEKDS